MLCKPNRHHFQQSAFVVPFKICMRLNLIVQYDPVRLCCQSIAAYRRIYLIIQAAYLHYIHACTDRHSDTLLRDTISLQYLKISFHLKRYEVVPGDWVEFGCIISNSEVGLGAVTIRPFLNRLICTNGCVVNDFGERKHHVGRQARAIEDSFELYSDETVKAEDNAFLLKLQDVARATLDESRYPLILSRLKDAVHAPITGKVQEVVELAGKAFSLNQAEQESVLDYLIRGGDMSMYGLSNAVTRASQDVESYDRATELESIGWDIISMEPAQWRDMNG